MHRRGFLSFLGVGAVAAPVAAKAIMAAEPAVSAPVVLKQMSTTTWSTTTWTIDNQGGHTHAITGWVHKNGRTIRA